ncbi:MAG: DUF4199 domain-containing protein [Rikenellaceae bacterium]|jgi:hypothetical protein|nr:DUF4199 domain-containing protein [Rikenellaceae bacterium]
MDASELKKTFWNEAATGGLILGLLMFGLSYVVYVLDWAISHGTIVSFLQVLLMGGVIWAMGTRMTRFRGPVLGFPYGQSMKLVLAIMFFAGIIHGLGEFLLQMVIAPEYFKHLYEEALLNSGQSEAVVEQAMAMREKIEVYLKNPLVMVLSGILTMCFMGGIVGMILSIFLKKKPDVFAEEEQADAR